MKKYWDNLTTASKIVFILWDIDAFYMLFSGKSKVNFFEWIIVWLFGCFLFVGIAQLISRKRGKKYPTPKTLSSTDALPVINTPNLILSNGEICHYCSPATFIKTKNVVVGYSGGSRGTNIRIAKGMSVRVGAQKAAPVRGNVQDRTLGILSITNKRIVFSGNKGAFDKKISTLSAVTPFQNGIAFQFGNQQYPLETNEPEYIHEILTRIVNSSEDI